MNAGYDEYGEDPHLVFAAVDNQARTATNPSDVSFTWELHGDNGNAITVSWGNIVPTQFKLRINSYDYGSIGKINARLYAGPDPENPSERRYVYADCMVPYSRDPEILYIAWF